MTEEYRINPMVTLVLDVYVELLEIMLGLPIAIALPKIAMPTFGAMSRNLAPAVMEAVELMESIPMPERLREEIAHAAGLWVSAVGLLHRDRARLLRQAAKSELTMCLAVLADARRTAERMAEGPSQE